MSLRFPDPENASDSTAEQAQNSATCLAMAGVLAVCVGLGFLTYLIIPTALYLVAIVFVFGGLLGLHYLIWGRLLTRNDDSSENQVERFWERSIPEPSDPDVR
jgi:threonine/homoserine/homoserine lactone efflux protein